MSIKDIDKILPIVNQAVYACKGRYLKDKEEKVLIGSLKGLTYKEIAKENNYVSSTLARDVAPKLWRILSEASGEKVTKKNVNGAIRRLVKSFPFGRVNNKKSGKNFFILANLFQKSLKALIHRLLNHLIA